MKTKQEWQEKLAAAIEEIKVFDRRRDISLRNQAIARLLGDENHIPIPAAKKALRDAGFAFAVR